MQSLPHRRRSDAGPQAVSQAQATTTDPCHADATERPALSYMQCDTTGRPPNSLPSSDHSTSNFLDHPLTVPVIFKQVHDRQSGRVSGTEWNTYHVSPSQWATLRELLERSDIWDKLRVNYFSQTQTFVHQMPGLIHDVARGGFAKLFFRDLDSICRDTMDGEAFMDQVTSRGSSDVVSIRGPGLHQPDDCFCCLDDYFYGVVLEVAYSQKSEELEKLAQFYLFESSLNIRKVIGISFDYFRSKRITLHVWKRDNSGKTAGGQLRHYSREVRTEAGAQVSGPPLKISVFDIAPPALVPSSLHGATIQIPLDKLCHYIEKAELANAEEKKRMEALQSQRLDGSDRGDDDSSQESEDEDGAGTKTLDEDYVPSRVGRKDPESGRSLIRTRSRTSGAFSG
ncbi:hypothetical protein AYO21_07493 [Fonsecaea monophora]|uniref:Uncharacterized protein n=1 Tax=Fonsecaea monophora TaxID=254056 RepID=A0A177F1R7_9EURO|nr:hypothetical protein AYO21_07493 [Fonsecaea monophora]OAG38267.1 hypothetical protein AYO21_07493 [Fonsecaea monophora]